MILSHKEIEDIAAAVTKDFNAFFFKDEPDGIWRMPRTTPIDQFALDYLGLSVSFTHLSSDGSFCGLTAYEDTEYTCEIDGVTRTIPLKRNEVLLDSSFLAPGQVRRLCGKRRFTLAHECAHQILFQLASDETKAALRRTYPGNRSCSLRDLKTREDWNEWQANALGAAILMPREEVDLGMRRLANGRKLRTCNGRFSSRDSDVILILMNIFHVSRPAIKIRLKRLGYLEEITYREKSDSMEVFS